MTMTGMAVLACCRGLRLKALANNPQDFALMVEGRCICHVLDYASKIGVQPVKKAAAN
jgi:hypothetical protein